MKVNRREFDKFVEKVKKAMGGDLVDTIDRVADAHQFAFATNEPDRGEDARGRWTDLIARKLKEFGWYYKVPCLPFPVSGRLVYVLGVEYDGR